MGRWHRWATAAILVATPALAGGRAGQETQPRVNPDALLIKTFTDRVQQYAELHRKLEATLPPLGEKAEAAAIEHSQDALARLIRQARPRAEQGEIFSKDVRALVRRLLHPVLAGPDGKDIRATILDENPGRIRLEVNGRYPAGAPLSTVPPQVLAALPRLPEEVEYRFIGSTMILRDIHANLIVDFVADALP
jgi:hypothetical protein